MNDPAFFEKLHLCKTAFGPLYNQCIGILKIYRTNKDPIIVAYLKGESKEKYIFFRPCELINYVV